MARTKATIQDMAEIGDHDAAVDRELTPQVWSLEQPAFKERVAALQAKIAKR
jgi:enoyl-CoA hydratase